jgi:ATP-dependent DNA helicase PIF1
VNDTDLRGVQNLNP